MTLLREKSGVVCREEGRKVGRNRGAGTLVEAHDSASVSGWLTGGWGARIVLAMSCMDGALARHGAWRL